MLDITTANLTAADVYDVIIGADNATAELLSAFTKYHDTYALAASAVGVVYYNSPTGKGGRKAQGTLDEVCHMLKGKRWTGSDFGLPNLQDKTAMMKFAMVGLTILNGGTILTRKNDIVHPVDVMTAVNNAYRVKGVTIRDIEMWVTGQPDAQTAYDTLVRETGKRNAENKVTTEVTTEAPEAPEATPTTDADLVTSVMSILSGWKFDGTANIDAIFDKVAEIAGASIPATV
jgi:hypothetical protein